MEKTGPNVRQAILQVSKADKDKAAIRKRAADEQVRVPARTYCAR